MENGAYIGLGYFNHSVEQQYRDDHKSNQDTPRIFENLQGQSIGSAVEESENYVNLYLQQCLKYHEDQEALRRQRQQQLLEHPTATPLHNDETKSAAVQFISSGVFDIKVEEVTACRHQRDGSADQKGAYESSKPVVTGDSLVGDASTPPPPAIVSSASISSSSVESAAAEGRRRAQAILLRFQQQQEQLLFNQTLVSVKEEQEEPQQQQQQQALLWFRPPEESPEPLVYLEQRRRGMQRENMVRKQALLKNLDYVAEKERIRSLQLQDHIAQAKQLEEQAKAQYEAASMRRKQRILESMSTQAGIGTKKRKKAERIKEKEGHVPQKSKTNNTHTLAIYFAGLAPDCALTSEDTVKELFGSYGSIQKVHLYLNKESGGLKGDGLVIYNVKGGDQENFDLMNGAVLPNGAKLRVEPASSSKNRLEGKQLGLPLMPLKESAHFQQNEAKSDMDDDLDDFFASL